MSDIQQEILKINWVAVKELNFSYHSGGTILITIRMYIYIYIPILLA